MIKKIDSKGFFYTTLLNCVCSSFALWMKTVRVQRVGEHKYFQDDYTNSHVVAFWHNRVLGLSFLFKRSVCEKSTGMTSQSRDGQLIADIMESRGFSTVRGSSNKRGKSKGGAKAFIQSLKVLKTDNKFMCMVPDGPRGPMYSVQPGTVMLASKSGKSILPVAMRCSRYISLPSWDKLMIPLPFSKVDLVVGEELFIQDKLNDEELDLAKEKLKKALDIIS